MSSESLSIDHLLTLEHDGWTALCRSEGGSFYGDLMTPDAVMVLVNGMVLDRPGVVASLNAAPPWSSYLIEDAQLVPVSGSSAALVYRARASREGEADPFVALMTSHYTLVEGRPALALYQQTSITT
ncbi:nuclear transport factor 2 family protein [Leucobacter sp. USCH14]|uniref:nuclear transport factor 2 family protein n=1 Tax=Leucobacter sp. USCH14 TaxID=3024838 RepID=UPI003095AED5